MRLVAALLLLAAIFATHAEVETGEKSPLPTDCGRFIDFKYFFGNRTDLDDYPWTVLLEYKTPWGKRLSCGGALISNRHVLTAAHCVAKLGGNWLLEAVRLSEYDTAGEPDCLPEGDADNSTYCIDKALSVKIEKVQPHEKYGKAGRAHDIALIKLAEEVQFGDFVKPICVPKEPSIPQRYHVSGWGRLAGRRGTNLKLRSMLTLSNATACRDLYKKERVILGEDQLCAGGGVVEEEEPCIADSGGPLMGVEKAEDGSYRMTIFGVLTTDSKFCDRKSWPAIFTDVVRYRDWILQHL